MDTMKLFKKSIDAERIDLAKLGWTESQLDKKILSYVRGYIWRVFGIRIKEPIDWIIFFMINEVLASQMDIDKIKFTNVLCKNPVCPMNQIKKCKAKKIIIDPIECEFKNY